MNAPTVYASCARSLRGPFRWSAWVLLTAALTAVEAPEPRLLSDWGLAGRPLADARHAFAVAAAGDVNGDGFGDVIVGSPFCKEGGTEWGCASL